ncbi:MAG: hypothetical protein K2J77_10075 [Oscillospiraceae bacterium]|nr:hypothetical protein [Oscillospiraceae bacterium]
MFVYGFDAATKCRQPLLVLLLLLRKLFLAVLYLLQRSVKLSFALGKLVLAVFYFLFCFVELLFAFVKLLFRVL